MRPVESSSDYSVIKLSGLICCLISLSSVSLKEALHEITFAIVTESLQQDRNLRIFEMYHMINKITSLVTSHSWN